MKRSSFLERVDGIIFAHMECAKFGVEELNQTLIIDGVVQIREAKSPALIREMLIAYLPEGQRAGLIEDEAA